MEVIAAEKLADPGAYKTIVSLVLGGAVFCYPTDTCYALGSSALVEEVVYKIYTIKGRDTTKALPVVVRDIGVARRFAAIGPPAQAVLSAFPGISVVVPKRGIPDIVNPRQIMLRIPSDPLSQAFLSSIPVPVVSTSANRAGDPNPYAVGDIMRSLAQTLPLIDFALDGGVLASRPPSTILDCIEGKVYREGSHPADEVLEVFHGAH